MYTNGTMLEIGYPRNDLLYAPNKDQIALDLKKKLHIPLDKKTILYAPTWRDDEYYGKEKEVVTGIVQRVMGKNVSINLGKGRCSIK